MKTGGPAFPLGDSLAGLNEKGMTLRDYFAAAVVSSLQPGARDDMDGNWWYSPKVIAERSYAIADAMLKAREA